MHKDAKSIARFSLNVFSNVLEIRDGLVDPLPAISPVADGDIHTDIVKTPSPGRESKGSPIVALH